MLGGARTPKNSRVHTSLPLQTTRASVLRARPCVTSSVHVRGGATRVGVSALAGNLAMQERRTKQGEAEKVERDDCQILHY
jgi:hypothetical protein